MASRRIEDLHPTLQPLARTLLTDCAAVGVDVLIYCTYRSNEEQNELYARGRTKPGSVVTRVRGGQSRHNHTENGVPASLAFDCVPMVHGRPDWDAHEAYDNIAAVGRKLGLTWGGDWKSFQDKPHFEIPEPVDKPTVPVLSVKTTTPNAGTNQQKKGKANG
jgi:peptidoglycan LD-endopeptidase CwlK